ncbi:methyltransferase [Streptomyces morookaense]|uniref:Methyltransferase n=1 Tax=Streptomyces morookaense TaxID=1970 RepID=A0A7Y7B505_STRMO|nr:methyltransferase [Streptomyces morookaense]
MTAEPSTLDDINRIGIAFAQAKVVLSAIELDLFSTLAAGPATEQQLCEKIGLHPRGARDFLTALVCFGLLRKDGDTYTNAPAADRFLDKAKPEYSGAFLERANRMMYPAWSGLTGLLRTGDPQLAGREDQAAAFERMMADPGHLRNFLRMMDAVSGPLGPHLAAAFDWSEHRTVLDVGGARGNLLAQVLMAQPHLTGGVFDLPAIAPMFDEHIAGFGLTDRAAFTGGDFFVDDLPSADIVVTGHVLHDWTPDERARLVRKMADAVRPGGALLIYDQLLEEAPDDPWNTLISLNMQLITNGGSEYTLAECTAWLADAGLESVQTVPLGEHDTLVIARKPAEPKKSA